MVRRIAIFLFVSAACDDPPRTAVRVDASVEAPPPPAPLREGCARSGSFDGVEADTACVVTRGDDNAMRAAMQHVAITLDVEPRVVATGGRAVLNLSIRNTANTESTFYFEARVHPMGPRQDWSRLSGIPSAQPNAPKSPRLLFLLTTADARGNDVDALPTVQDNGPSPPAKLLGVHLKAGASLTRSISWLALRIPPPAPVYKDDAGHRYYPKTAPTNLAPGEYTLTVEIPFFGAGRERNRVTTTVRVTPPPAESPP